MYENDLVMDVQPDIQILKVVYPINTDILLFIHAKAKANKYESSM